MASFTVFQNLNLGNVSTNPKWHLTIFWATSYQYQWGMQSFIAIVHSVWPFLLFQNFKFGTASTDVKCHFTISWLDLAIPLSRSFNSNGYAKFYQNIPEGSRDRPVSLFSEFEPRQNLDQSQMSFHNLIGYILPMKNVISQSLGLDLVNINVYPKVYQNIPLSSRERAIFTFSEFGTRQNLDRR